MWLTSVVLAGGLGLLLGWEGSTFKNDARYEAARTGWVKPAMLLMFAMGVATRVESLRGFLVVYLSALGAYYLAKQFGGIAEKYWYRWRDPHPIVESLRLSKEKNLIEFYIRSKCTSPIVVESIFLKGAGDKIISIDAQGYFRIIASLIAMAGFAWKDTDLDHAGLAPWS